MLPSRITNTRADAVGQLALSTSTDTSVLGEFGLRCASLRVDDIVNLIFCWSWNSPLCSLKRYTYYQSMNRLKVPGVFIHIPAISDAHPLELTTSVVQILIAHILDDVCGMSAEPSMLVDSKGLDKVRSGRARSE